ncbi:MAG: alpha/beta fold hydrolase [Gemmatimonadetes bacterium]|nr:alpha/beta fold hydrolase [Gemmatimonadota bacterium]
MASVRLGQLTCHYEDRGRGPALLWIHAFPFDRRMWAPQLDVFSEGYRALAPDLRGFGESNLGRGFYTINDLADDMAALLEALGIESAVVGGLSMGGYVAFALVRGHPGRVRGLILADTRPEADTPEARERRRAMAEQVSVEGTHVLVEDLLPRLVSDDTRRQRPGVVATLEKMILAARPAAVIAALDAMAARPESRDLLPAITVPTCVIAGAQDVITPPDVAREMASAIPGARQYVLIPGAGHMSNLERPDLFNAAVREFLSGLP